MRISQICIRISKILHKNLTPFFLFYFLLEIKVTDKNGLFTENTLILYSFFFNPKRSTCIIYYNQTPFL